MTAWRTFLGRLMAPQDGARQVICERAWSGRLLAFLVAALCLTGTGRAEQASEGLPTEPVLRIETGQHGAQIRRIDTDAANRFAVTASDDKTVRVWSLPDGRLLQVLRLPLDSGNIGKAFAVAMSPDGGTIAIGGWTGSWGHHNIYLFDRASGELTKRLADLPSVVDHLAYSPDGRRLAASLGDNGIRVFDASHDYRLLPSDTEYKDSSYSAMFDRTGRLVTASDDEFVRLYAADQYAHPIKLYRLKGHRPYPAAFSPDGARVAIGFEDTHDVRVLSGSNLTRLFEAKTTGVRGSINKVGWSKDGRFLFAGGFWSVNNVWQVRRWSKGGRGAFIDIPAGSETIMEILGLQSGSMLFAHAYGFGLIGPDAKMTPFQGLGGLDVASGGGHELRVSADGGAVQVDAWQPLHTYRFALGERRADSDPPADAALLAPVTQAPGLDVTNWNSSTTPAVNGRLIKLSPNEQARSLAVVPGTQRFVLGTEFYVRLFDQQGQELWPEPLPGPGTAWHVNVTGDGRLVVVAYNDGTIRWLRLSDGKELLALFMDPDGKRWIAWTPQGYYDASVGGDELIGWHLNNGYDRVPDFYPVAQFRDQFNRPDIVALVLKTLDVDEAVRQANAVSGRKAPTAVADSLPPVVKIVSPADLSAEAESPIEVSYLVRSPTPVTGVTVMVDGRPVATTTPNVFGSSPNGTLASLSIDMPQHDAIISLVATNEKASSVAAVVHIGWQGAKDWDKPKLFVLAVGVSKYNDKYLDLTYPHQDAEDFVKVMQAQEGGALYKQVFPHDLSNGQATLQEIRKGLGWLQKMTTKRDVAMLFLSGHGQSDAGGHYHYLPFDTKISDLRTTTLEDSEIENALGEVPGKVIAFLDTCFSGGLHPPDVNRLANELRSAKKGVVVFTSSTGNEVSQENGEWNNGAYTKALVEALSGGIHQPSKISITILEAYLEQRVRYLTKEQQHPTLAKPSAIENYDDYFIATVAP